MNEIIANPFAPEGTKQQSGGAVAMASRENTEVMALAAMAKRFPRDVIVAADRIRNAFMRPTLAEKAQYQFARGGTDIVGPSIRAAEAMAQQWGNMSEGWREISRGIDAEGIPYSEIEAFCVDYESVSRASITFMVPHWRDTKKGGYKLTDDRDIYELCANQASRRKRACILAKIPGDVTEMAMDQASATLKARADTSPEGIKALLATFAEFGVTQEQIEKRIQRRMDSIQPAQIVGLKRIFVSLRDDMSAPGDWFDGASVEKVDPKTIEGIRAAAAAKKAAGGKGGGDAAGAPPASPNKEAAAPTPAPAPAKKTPAAPAAAAGAPPAINEAAYAEKLKACKDRATLQLMGDDIRDVADDDVRVRLFAIWEECDAALAAG